MPKFKKKSVVIEAEKFDGGHTKGVFRDEDGMPYVITIHAQRCYVEAGDWIIPEPDKIHYYPCKNEIFIATYDPCDETEPVALITRMIEDDLEEAYNVTRLEYGADVAGALLVAALRGTHNDKPLQWPPPEDLTDRVNEYLREKGLMQ